MVAYLDRARSLVKSRAPEKARSKNEVLFYFIKNENSQIFCSFSPFFQSTKEKKKIDPFQLDLNPEIKKILSEYKERFFPSSLLPSFLFEYFLICFFLFLFLFPLHPTHTKKRHRRSAPTWLPTSLSNIYLRSGANKEWNNSMFLSDFQKILRAGHCEWVESLGKVLVRKGWIKQDFITCAREGRAFRGFFRGERGGGEKGGGRGRRERSGCGVVEREFEKERGSE